MAPLDLYGPPPSKVQLAEARMLLEDQESSAKSLSDKVADAKAALERLIAESQGTINELEQRKQKVEKEIALTLAFISPLRRLPNDILREVFYHVFDAKASCAWGLAAVCTSWRRLVLGMPSLWSKIRLTTTLNSSPDVIRLWLERSGARLPLDVEIRLIVPYSGNKRVNPHAPPPQPWTQPWMPGSPQWALPAPGSPMQDLYPPHAMDAVTTVDDDNDFDQFNAPMPWPAHPPAPPGVILLSGPSRHSRDKNKYQVSRTTAAQWAHVTMFYLTEQMHRWRRFVFRFDRQFASIGALKAISGDAPLLEEFEVSCAEAIIYNVSADGQQMPLTHQLQPKDAAPRYPRLRSITLQCVPFRWSAAVLSSGLRSLTLRSLASTNINLDRLVYIIDNNQGLEYISLNFQNVHQAILPLNGTTLCELKTLMLSGSHLLPSLLDALTTPALEKLVLDLEPREPIEEAIASLLTRSGGPPLTCLTIAYTNASPFYPGVGVLGAWAFLAGSPGIKSLTVGQTSFENVVSALGRPTGAPGGNPDNSDDEDGPGPVGGVDGPGVGVNGPVGVIAADIEPGTWLVPSLERLTLRACHAHSDVAVQKLIKLVEERNPLQLTNGENAGVEPQLTRLKSLEVHDCVSLGEDVLKWLRARITEVKYTELTYNRPTRSPSSYIM